MRRTVDWNSRGGLVFVAMIAVLFLARGQIQKADTALVRDDPACPHSSDFPAQEADPAARQEILCLLNVERAKVNLPPLREEAHLDQAAQVQSDDIAARDFFAHVNPDGKTPGDRIFAAGYRQDYWTGENILWAEERLATPVRAMRAWMHSPGHRANILRANFTEVGIGVTLGAPQPVRSRAAVYATTFGGPPPGISQPGPG